MLSVRCGDVERVTSRGDACTMKHVAPAGPYQQRQLDPKTNMYYSSYFHLVIQWVLKGRKKIFYSFKQTQSECKEHI